MLRHQELSGRAFVRTWGTVMESTPERRTAIITKQGNTIYVIDSEMLFISNILIKYRLMGGTQTLGCCSIFGPRSKIRKFTKHNRRHQIPNWGIGLSIKRTHVLQILF